MQGFFYSDTAVGRRNWPHSGQGGAFRQIGPTKIAVFTVVNATITLIVTNQKLEVRELQRLAIQVHMSIGRGIQPFSTTDGGDVLFAVTTDAVDNPSLSALDLSTIASETAWDAILASVPKQDPVRPSTPIRALASDLDAVVGTYEFPSGARVTVRCEGEQLRTTLAMNARLRRRISNLCARR